MKLRRLDAPVPHCQDLQKVHHVDGTVTGLLPCLFSSLRRFCRSGTSKYPTLLTSTSSNLNIYRPETGTFTHLSLYRRVRETLTPRLLVESSPKILTWREVNEEANPFPSSHRFGVVVFTFMNRKDLLSLNRRPPTTVSFVSLQCRGPGRVVKTPATPDDRRQRYSGRVVDPVEKVDETKGDGSKTKRVRVGRTSTTKVLFYTDRHKGLGTLYLIPCSQPKESLRYTPQNHILSDSLPPPLCRPCLLLHCRVLESSG